MLVVQTVVKIGRKKLDVRNYNFIPIIAYLAILFIVVLITKDNYVWLWDSTRLWGAVPKALYYTEKLQLGKDALVYPFMQSYPPGMPLLGYFIESFNGDFLEWQLYLTYGAFVSSLFIPGIKKLSRKSIVILPITCLIILLIPCLVTSNGGDSGFFYNSLFIDPVLGALFGYGIFVSTNTNYKSVLSTGRLIIVLIAITLLKDSGIMFAVALYIISVTVYCGRGKRLAHKEVALAVLALLCSLIAWESWKILLNKWQIYAGIKNFYHSLDRSIISALLKNILKQPSFVWKTRGEVAVVHFSLILVLLIELLTYIYVIKKSKVLDRRSFYTVMVIVLLFYGIFFVGYGLTFGETLPSFQRYTNTLTIAPLVYLFIVITNYKIETWEQTGIGMTYTKLLSLCIMVAILGDSLVLWEKNTDLSHFVSYEDTKEHSDYIIATIYENEGIEKKNPKENIDVYLLYSGIPSNNCLTAQRLYMNLIGSGIRIKNNYSEMQIVNWDSTEESLSVSEVAKYIREWESNVFSNYDYIYIYYVDDNTKEVYSGRANFELEDRKVYKVDKEKKCFEKCN